MSPFTSWTRAEPWWATLLLLPALVMAAVVGRVLRAALLAGIVAGVALLALLVWLWRPRR